MIKDLSELKKLLSLCRKAGVSEIEIADLKLKFGDLPEDKEAIQEDQPSDLDAIVGFDPQFKDMDAMAFYSSPLKDTEQ